MPRNNRSRQRYYPNGQPIVSLHGYKRRLAAFTVQQRAEYDRIMRTRHRVKESPQQWAEIEREAVELVVQQIGVKERRPVDVQPSTNYAWVYRG